MSDMEKSKENNSHQNSSDSDSESFFSEEAETIKLHTKEKIQDNHVLVIIIKCETRECDKNIENLKKLFSDPYFIVQICQVDEPENIPPIKNLTTSQYIENYNMQKTLNYAAEGPYSRDKSGTIKNQRWWKDLPCIIIKDSSVSNVSPYNANNDTGGLKKRIQVALDKASEADLHFLCKWSDSCNKYLEVSGANDIENGSSLKWSLRPTSSQAIMYTSKARDFIREKLRYSTVPMGQLLNSYIASGKLLATAFVPNIIDYDISLSTNDNDYLKLSECDNQQVDTYQTSYQQLLWLGIIIFAVVVLAVLLAIFTSTNPGSLNSRI